MKKVLTLAAFYLVFITMSQAQFVLGGNIGFNSAKLTDEFAGDKSEATVTNVTLIPRLGYAFGDFWAGLDVGISNLKYEEEDYNSKLNLVNVSPFFRYTKKPTENFGVWIEGQAGFQFGKAEDDGEESAKYSGINAGIRPGVIFFIGDHLSFEASFGRLGFSSTTVTDPDDSDNKTTISNVGLSLNGNGIDLTSLTFLDESPTSLVGGFLFGVNYTFGGGSGDK